MPNEELFWHWRSGISPYFQSVPLTDPRNPPLAPEVHLYNPGAFLFFDTKLSRQKFIRDADWLRRNDDSDHVGLQLFLRGQNQVDHGDLSFLIEPGDINIVNLGYEVDASCTDAEVLSVILPRHTVAEHLPNLHDARGLQFRAGSTAARLLTDFMHSLRRTFPVAPASDAAMLSHSMIGMLRVLFADGDPLSAEAQHGALTALQRHIDLNLGDPTLGIDSLCATYRMSRSTLYRLFQGQGGVRAYILRRRLMASFKALTTPGQMRRGIFDLALDYGFSSPSHFATRFRGQFGMTPSEVREAARAHLDRGNPAILSPATSNLPDVELMRRWTQEIGEHHRSAPNGRTARPTG